MINREIYLGSLTPSEYFRLHDTLPAPVIEELVDEAKRREDQDVSPNLEEASGCFINEDFLGDEISRLESLTKTLRGANRVELTEIIGAVREAVEEQVRESEYGRDEIRRAISTIA